MGKVEYLKFLDKMNQAQLQDYLEAVWKEEITISSRQEEWLQEHVKELKYKKYAVYVMVWLLLLALLTAVPEYEGPVRRVFDNLEPVDPQDPTQTPYELVWVTVGDDRVCPICAPLDGKVWGKDIKVIPQIHPGCRCKLVIRKKRAMSKIRTLDAGAVRAISEGQKRILEVLAAPFGSPTRKDKLGQFLSENTDFMLEIGDKRPLLYFHGFTPRAKAMKQPFSIGSAVATRIDKKGLWMQAELGDDELSDRTWEAALKGEARASTGSVNYLERHDEATGEVYCWPIAELSVFDSGDNRVPVSDDAIVLPLRALYNESGIELPEHFEAGEDKKSEAAKRNLDIRKDKMNEEIKTAVAEALAAQKAEEEAKKAEREAMRAELLKELQAEPKYRSTFNVNTINDKEAKKDADKEETFAYVRSLIEDAKIVFQGGMPRNAMRVLEETEALELGPMVPTDLYNQIHGILGKYSLPDKCEALGLMTIYKTDKLTFSVPTETTAMTALADIAEEGAYTANEMAFAAKDATMQKVGNYLSVTEEALEDQDLFQQYLAKACAKAIALSKNADFEDLLNTIDGTEVATTHTITDSEIVQTLYYGLAQEYREGAAFFMNDATLGYVRAMLVATPRAYGEFGFAPMSMGELGERFLNHYVFTNSNWASIASAADDVKIIDFVNLDEVMYWVERRNMSIFVDPYSTKLSAGTVNFLPSARYGGVIVNSAALSGLDDHA